LEDAEEFHTEERSLHAQKVDEALTAREKFPKSEYADYSRWRSRYNRSDIAGIDLAGNVIIRGPPDKPTKKATKKELEKHPIVLRGARRLTRKYQPIADKRFSDLTKKDMEHRTIKVKETRKLGLGGYYAMVREERLNPKTGLYETRLIPKEIAINPLYNEPGQESNLVHELVHFRRHVQKDAKLRHTISDTDQDEKETTHETSARTGEENIIEGGEHGRGYYLFSDRPYPQVRIQDMDILHVYSKKGKVNTSQIEKNIAKFQDKTFLQEVDIVGGRRKHQGRNIAPEDIDIYMRSSEGDVYHFHNPRAKPIDKNRLALFIDRADREEGEEDIYELRDGKPVLIRKGKR